MTGERRGFHSGEKYFARKERKCRDWWLARCVIKNGTDNELSVPCAMFERCMYAAQREDYTADDLEVLDAWAHAKVCLIGFSERWAPDTLTVRDWELL